MSGQAVELPAGDVLRPLGPSDGPALAAFYNGLSEASKHLFRPIGMQTDLAT